MKKLKIEFWAIFRNQLHQNCTNISKPKNMINIPGIPAKYKKSSDLHDSLKIDRDLKYGLPKKIQKKELPLVAKNLVWETFLENQDFTQKSPKP